MTQPPTAKFCAYAGATEGSADRESSKQRRLRCVYTHNPYHVVSAAGAERFAPLGLMATNKHSTKINIRQQEKPPRCRCCEFGPCISVLPLVAVAHLSSGKRLRYSYYTKSLLSNSLCERVHDIMAAACCICSTVGSNINVDRCSLTSADIHET